MNIKSITDIAIENLRLQRILIRSSCVEVNEQYQFQLSKWTTSEHIKQTAKNPVDIRVTSVNEHKHYVFGFFFGSRIVSKDEPEKIIFKCEATFDAIYTSKIELEDEFLDLFHKQHVCYHMIPYWREFLQSSVLRTGMPNLSVPFYTLGNLDTIDQ